MFNNDLIIKELTEYNGRRDVAVYKNNDDISIFDKLEDKSITIHRDTGNGVSIVIKKYNVVLLRTKTIDNRVLNNISQLLESIGMGQMPFELNII